MGWFGKQIEERKRNDDDMFSESFENLAEAIVGKRMNAALRENSRQSKTEIDRILVLDKGKIIGDGDYETLLKENPFFESLVSRQRLDIDGANDD